MNPSTLDDIRSSDLFAEAADVLARRLARPSPKNSSSTPTAIGAIQNQMRGRLGIEIAEAFENLMDSFRPPELEAKKIRTAEETLQEIEMGRDPRDQGLRRRRPE